MKKTYETPEAEKMEFCYRDQVVAASATGDKCLSIWVNTGDGSSTDGNEHLESLN